MKNKFNISFYEDISFIYINDKSYIYHKNYTVFGLCLYKSRIINDNPFGIKLRIYNDEKE